MAQLKVIKNCQIVLENGILWDGALIIEGNKILDFGKERDIKFPENAEIIDANGNYVGPGLVDIHVHGGNGFFTYVQVEEAGEFFLSHGETSIFPTPSAVLNADQLVEVFKNVREKMKTVKNVKGMYMESPFMNCKFGAFKDDCPWRETIPFETYSKLADEAGDVVKVWMLAPERQDVKGFTEYARKVNPNVVFAVGHSEATPMQIRALGKCKPTIQTHSMCATGRIPVMSGTRGYGPDEFAFKDNDVYCELISDSNGLHVHPEMQQLLLHNKGVEKVILVTDSTIHKNPNPQGLEHIDDLNFNPAGALAGSKLTLDKACRNVMQSTNCGIAQAFLMASTNPSKALGLDDKIGSIEVGKTADLVIVDDKFNIKKVILEGEVKF